MGHLDGGGGGEWQWMDELSGGDKELCINCILFLVGKRDDDD